jgi:hypothetical protein
MGLTPGIIGGVVFSKTPSDLREIFAAFDRVGVPEGSLSPADLQQEPSQKRGENSLRLQISSRPSTDA